MDTQELHLGETSSKEERINSSVVAIQDFFPPKTYPLTGEVNRHTNDAHFSLAWSEAIEELPAVGEAAKGKVRVGLIVGAGGTPSTFPELLPNIDLLLFTDYDQRALDWVRFTFECLEKYSSLSSYEGKVYSPKNPLLKSVGANIGASSYFDEMRSLGDYHILSSENRYKQSRAALLKAKAQGRKFGFVPMDLRDSSEGEKLAQALSSDSEIIYANMTNVAFHVIANAVNPIERFSLEEASRGFKDTLEKLPFADQGVIQYSALLNRRELPEAKVARGIESYLQQSIVMPPA